MPAKRIFYDKMQTPDGGIIEMVIWQLDSPVSASRHQLKYSLFYGREGERIVGYDNERGKGDHKHIQGQEFPYRFAGPEKLIEDFLSDVRRLGGIV